MRRLERNRKMSRICPSCGKEHDYRYKNGQCGMCYQLAAYRTDSHYREVKKASVKKARLLNPQIEKKSQRKKRLARVGLSVEQYDRMLVEQGGVCKICGRPPKSKRLSVDHNHRTGAIRGLLCWKCNTGIGWFREDVAALRKAADYLEGVKP